MPLTLQDVELAVWNILCQMLSKGKGYQFIFGAVKNMYFCRDFFKAKTPILILFDCIESGTFTTRSKSFFLIGNKVFFEIRVSHNFLITFTSVSYTHLT